MENAFGKLRVKLEQQESSPDEVTCHGLLTGYATTPVHDERQLCRQLGGGQPLPEETQGIIEYAVAEIRRELASGNFAPCLGSGPLRAGARRWLTGYFDAVSAHEDDWDQLGAMHPDAAFDLLLLHALQDESVARDLPEMDLPGPEYLEDDPQLLTEIVTDIYRLFHGLRIADDAPDVSDWPEFSASVVSTMGEEELMSLLVTGGDTIPFHVIEECAARGKAMVPFLREHIENPATRGEYADIPCWLGNLHAVMILGLMPGREAAEALLKSFRQITFDESEELFDELAGAWPALCANKRQHTTAAMADIVSDRSVPWQARSEALACVMAAALDEGPQALEEAIDGVAAICADERETAEFRVIIGHQLLDFPRERHRALMESLVALQDPESVVAHAYGVADIDDAFGRPDEPEWERFADPWSFYSPEAIGRRQQSREPADVDDGLADDWYGLDMPGESPLGPRRQGTYVREAPKTGRNDPCPCGSGRKYKKCCLNR